LLEQVRDSMGDDASLPAASTGKHQQRPSRVLHRPQLGLIELAHLHFFG
jgi:hypothetical protein